MQKFSIGRLGLVAAAATALFAAGAPAAAQQ